MVDIVTNPEWKAVRILERDEVALGGYGGNMNEQATALVARTELLKEEKADRSDIVQGQYSFSTIAEFEAAKAGIPLNSTVVIDETGSNQGTNTWNGLTLVKSPYDPLTQAKTYTDAAVNELGISNGNASGLSVTIVDENNKRTWLEADEKGEPTDYSSEVIAKKTANSVGDAIGITNVDANDLSVSIVDKDNRRTWLEADDAGEPTDYSMEVFKKKLDVVNTVENIVCWGDSMTAGAGGDGRSYPLILGELLTVAGSTAKVVNAGVGGETSVTITARQGGNPFIIKIDANTLPADTSPVRVTLLSIGGEIVRPLLQGASSFDGYFNGILCTLKLVQPNGASSSWNAANYYTLQRKTAGAALTIDRPHPFYLEISKPYWGDIHIIWIGQNNLADSAARHIADAKAMIQKMTAQNKKYIVIPRPFNSVETYDKAQKDAFDAEFFAAFGRRCLLIRQYLVEYGLADAGLTATSQDLIDIANGTVPEQLRVDVVHWKSAAYQILATQVFNRIKELGYI